MIIPVPAPCSTEAPSNELGLEIEPVMIETTLGEALRAASASAPLALQYFGGCV